MISIRRKTLHLILTHLAALTPFALLVLDARTGGLTVNPIQDATLRTGKAALVLLVLSLAVTPMNTLFGWRWTIPLRKWFGLYAFFYAGIHFLIFLVLDYGLDLQLLRGAILEKRFVLVGITAGLLLLPLALTSTKGWMRRLGKRWKRLHKLVYLAGILAVVHYIWLVKADIRVPLIYLSVVLILLALRIPIIRSAASRLKRRLPRNSTRAAVAQVGSLRSGEPY